MLLEDARSELAAKEHDRLAARNARAWLLTLRDRVEEVEEDTPEAYRKRRQLVRLLVSGITAGRDADGQLDVRITYRFGPPEAQDRGEMFAVGINDAPMIPSPTKPTFSTIPATFGGERLARVYRLALEDGSILSHSALSSQRGSIFLRIPVSCGGIKDRAADGVSDGPGTGISQKRVRLRGKERYLRRTTDSTYERQGLVQS